MFALICMHAAASKKRVWAFASIVGYLVFGFQLECLGYFTPPSGTHLHSRHYMIYLTHFLPLKEVLLYPIIFYPAWSAVRALRSKSEVFECWCVPRVSCRAFVRVRLTDTSTSNLGRVDPKEPHSLHTMRIAVPAVSSWSSCSLPTCLMILSGQVTRLGSSSCRLTLTRRTSTERTGTEASRPFSM